jgi:hypothetical protein
MLQQDIIHAEDGRASNLSSNNIISPHPRLWWYQSISSLCFDVGMRAGWGGTDEDVVRRTVQRYRYCSTLQPICISFLHRFNPSLGIRHCNNSARHSRLHHSIFSFVFFHCNSNQSYYLSAEMHVDADGNQPGPKKGSVALAQPESVSSSCSKAGYTCLR